MNGEHNLTQEVLMPQLKSIFTDTLSCGAHRASNDRKIREKQIGKDVEGSNNL